jgi:hypothetical protein
MVYDLPAICFAIKSLIYYANMPDGYQPIENYGVIGNLQTIALVGVNGSIDFLCFPYFDSPSLFGGLLDAERGGHFSLAPVFQNSRPKQIYLSNSNILLTRFLSPEGVAEVSDYMPVSVESGPNREPVRQLIRSAKCIRGEVRFQMSCDPKFDYGRAKHRVDVLSPKRFVWFPKSAPGSTRSGFGRRRLWKSKRTAESWPSLSLEQGVEFSLF